MLTAYLPAPYSPSLFPPSYRRAWIAHDLRYLGNDNDAVWIRLTGRVLNSKFRTASSRGRLHPSVRRWTYPSRRREETHTVSLARCLYSSHNFSHSSAAAVSPALHIETQRTPSGASHAPVYVSPSGPAVCTHARAAVVAHSGNYEVSDGACG